MSDFAVFDEGWRCWCGDTSCVLLNGYGPGSYVEVEVWREGWEESELVDPRKLPPSTNVYGLWWRAAGPLRAT